ncbi:MAG: hypothetical protein U1E78_01355 [Gammaproteobacteria bacterium]
MMRNNALDELLVGDIIFFMNASKQAMHVAVYAGHKSGVHFITLQSRSLIIQ